MDDDFCWLFVHWDYNQCVLFVSVLHSQVGRELFLPKRLWFSFRFDFHRCIGSSLTWKLCLRNSGGGTPFWWWSVFWKVGCRIWRVSVEHIYVCICIYNIYIYIYYIHIYDSDLIFHRWICSKKVHQGPSSHQIIKSLHPSPQLIIGFVKTTPPSPLELVRIKKTSKLISWFVHSPSTSTSTNSHPTKKKTSFNLIISSSSSHPCLHHPPSPDPPKKGHKSPLVVNHDHLEASNVEGWD